jgi:5-methylcytosine-specific restriction protein A
LETIAPQLAAHPCASRGCAGLAKHARFCDECVGQGKARDTRPTAAERGYGPAWQRYRVNYLRAHPICVDPFNIHCQQAVLMQSTRVDHIKPHCTDQVLFWAHDNHQPLCESCHNRKTAEFDGGFGRARRSN